MARVTQKQLVPCSGIYISKIRIALMTWPSKDMAEVGKGRCRDLREQEPAGPWGPQLLEPGAGGELPSQQVGAAR